MTTTALPHTSTPARRARTRGLAVVGAAATALGVWGAVIAASLLSGLLGWAGLALLERRTTRTRTAWTVTALAVVVVSLSGPLTAATTPAAAAVLSLMHLAVAAVLIPALRSSPPTS
jgi:hypothetical protein